MQKVTLPKIVKYEGVVQDGFPLDHYSYSCLTKFSSNPIMFKINYMNRDRIESTKNVSAIIGSAFHVAMQIYYGGIEGMVPQNEAEAIEFALKGGMDYLDKYEEGFIQYSKTVQTKQKAMELLAFGVTSYCKWKKYDPKNDNVIALEDEINEHVRVEWRGKVIDLPIKLKGHIDKVGTENGVMKITDFKTSMKFSDEEKIDGAKIIQAIQYYFLVYAKYGVEPYSFVYEEVKLAKNKDGGDQVKKYEIVYSENEMYFDFYLRFYEDVTRGLNGHMVYVPNIYTMFDNEVSIIAYIHRLDEPETRAKEMKRLQVDNITDLLRREIQTTNNMKQLIAAAEKQFVTAKNINYEDMTNEERIQTKLLEHGIILKFHSVVNGPSVDLYRYMPSIGIKMTRIASFVSDIEQVLGISGVRALCPIRDSQLVGFEVPRTSSRQFPALPAENGGFDLAVGVDVMGEVRRFDIRKAPHVLVAGGSGSGKSVFISNIVSQLIESDVAVDIHLYDPKQVEFVQFSGNPRVFEYEYEHEKITTGLDYLVLVMEERYEMMRKKGIRSIEGLDIPYKFVFIDEFADLIVSGASDKSIQLLAQKGRACGIHLIIATQRASAKILTGDIKVNFPVRAVFKMSKAVDSVVMLDESGAEKLIGKGDMLFYENGIERLQAFAPKE